VGPSYLVHNGTVLSASGQASEKSIAGGFWVVGQLDKEASQTRDPCLAKNATHSAARPDPSPRDERLLRVINQTDPRTDPDRVGEDAGSRVTAASCRIEFPIKAWLTSVEVSSS